MKKRTLYKITNGLDSWYVVASDPTKATNTLKEILDKDDYGASSKRDAKTIEVMATEVITDDTPFHLTSNRLVVVPSEESYTQKEVGELLQTFMRLVDLAQTDPEEARRQIETAQRRIEKK